MNFQEYITEVYGYTSANKAKTAEEKIKETQDKNKEDDNKKPEQEKTETGNKVYNAKLEESLFDTGLQAKIKNYIIDACTEMKISIRSVEYEDNGIMVHYNYDSEAPKTYRTDKNEIAKDIKDEVTDILDEQKYKVKRTLRSTVQDGVATITFIVEKVKEEKK